MTENKLKIRGARHHNLKNIDIDIPKNKLVVISGLVWFWKIYFGI